MTTDESSRFRDPRSPWHGTIEEIQIRALRGPAIEDFAPIALWLGEQRDLRGVELCVCDLSVVDYLRVRLLYLERLNGLRDCDRSLNDVALDLFQHARDFAIAVTDAKNFRFLVVATWLGSIGMKRVDPLKWDFASASASSKRGG